MTPEEICQRAAKRGVSLISICDHNCIDALPRLAAAAEKQGLCWIKGVELDCAFENRVYHVLAYGFDEKDAAFASLVRENRRKLDQMSIDLLEKMEADDSRVSMADFLAYENDPARGGWPALNYFLDRGIARDFDGVMLLYGKYKCSYAKAGFVSVEEAVSYTHLDVYKRQIKIRAQEFADIHGDAYVDAEEKERRDALVAYALPKNIEGLKTDLEKYRITYDVWFRESTLHESGAIDDIVKTLSEKGLTYEKDGAIWYKATAYGGEKDEVLIRANGNPTYFAADIAYHYNKFAVRGFDRVINVWGADHHGHVARLKGAMDAIGLNGNRLDIVLMQLVRLTRDGEVVRMSKRTGKAITLTDLLDEVPIDLSLIHISSSPTTASSTMILRSWAKAVSKAFFRVALSVALVMPTELPALAGLTNTG